ncbi:MAG: VanZ family protein [Pseudomonadales bacterium]
MRGKTLRITVFFIVLAAIFLPSIARSSGLWVYEIYRIQEHLGGDKLTHFLAGGALQAATLVLLSNIRGLRRILLACLIANLLVLGEEVSQYFIPSRHFEWSDLGWTLLGTATACVFTGFLVFLRELRRNGAESSSDSVVLKER